jgi:hypothetical protein
MQCSSCGTQLSPGAVACPCCGEPAPGKPSESPVEPAPAEIVFMEYSGAGRTQITPPDPTPQLFTAQQEKLIGQMPPSFTAIASPYNLDVEAIPYIDYDQHKEITAAQSQGSLPATYGPQIPRTTRSLPEQQQSESRRSLSAGVTALLIILAFLLVGGSGVTYYAAAVHPGELGVQATTVVQKILTAQVQATTQAYAQAAATFTATSPQSIYTQVTSRTPTISYPLNGPDTTAWVNYSETTTACRFRGGAYHAISSTQSAFTLCLAESTHFSNFAYQVQMTITKGDEGGLLFRMDDTHYSFYRFIIGYKGSYSLYALKNNTSDTLLTSGFSSAINIGFNNSNTVTVITYGSEIYLYVNGHYLAYANDSTSDSGKIGVTAVDNANPTEVIFSNAEVWNLQL